MLVYYLENQPNTVAYKTVHNKKNRKSNSHHSVAMDDPAFLLDLW